jgi:hypothetical protein
VSKGVSTLGFRLLLLFAVGIGLWGLLQAARPSKPDAIPEPPIEELRESAGFEEMEGPRSSQWPKVRAEHLRKHPTCAACGSVEDLNVHHLQPFHLDPSLELYPPNLLTVCREHHFYVCHDPDGPWEPGRPNWSAVNPKAKEHCDSIKSNKRSLVLP